MRLENLIYNIQNHHQIAWLIFLINVKYINI